MNKRGEKWFAMVPPEERLVQRRSDILNLLKDGSKTFSQLEDLARKEGIGSGTLSRHLKALVERGVIQRHVDTATYPPTVTYSIARGGPESILESTPPIKEPLPSCKPEVLDSWLTELLSYLKERLLLRLFMAVLGEADTEEDWLNSLKGPADGEVWKLFMRPGESLKRFEPEFHAVVKAIKQLPSEARERAATRILALASIERKTVEGKKFSHKQMVGQNGPGENQDQP